MSKILMFLISMLCFCSCHGDSWDLGNGYSYCEKAIYKQDENGIDTLVLFPEIVDYNYDSRCIIAFQKFSSELLNNDTILLGSEIKYFQQMEKLKRQYWIINKISNKVYGPLNKKKYKDMVDSLKIQLVFQKQ